MNYMNSFPDAEGGNAENSNDNVNIDPENI